MLAIFALMVIAGTLISVKYADKIEKLVIEELNKKLSRPVSIREVEFSIFKKFPKATVKLADVRMEGVSNKEEDFILAKSIYFSLDFLSLFQDEILVNEIDIEEGEINVKIDKNGNGNWNILKETKADSSDKSILNIQEINLLNVALKYENIQQKQSYKIYSEDSELSFNMGDHQQFILANFEGKIQQIKIPGYEFKNEVASQGNLEIRIDDAGVDYLFKNGEINGQELWVDGFYNSLKKNNELSFKIKQADLEELRIFFPKNDDKSWEAYQAVGILNLSGKLTTSAKGISGISVQFNLKEGELILDKNLKNGTLTDLNLSGTYVQSNFSKLNSAVINLNEFSFKLGNNSLNGKAKITELNQFALDAEVKGSFDISDLSEFFVNDKLESITGKINLNTKVKGYLMDLIQNKNLASFNQLKTEGLIEISDFGFVVKNQKNSYQNISGAINFNNQNIQLLEFKGKINSTEFSLNGIINNYLETFLNHQALDISATVNAGKFKLEEFIQAENTPVNSSNSSEEYNFNLPKNLHLNLILNMEEFAFRNFVGSNIKGQVHLESQIFSFDHLSFNSCDGEVQLKGKIASTLSNTIIYEGNLNLISVNLTKLFTEMENFGQGFLQAKHLKGNLNTDIYFLAESDSALNFNPNKIYTKAGIKIKNGELNNLESLIELEKFLKSEFKINLNLKELKFANLENTIEILNQVIYLPEMKIASSGINMEVSGTHSFNQEINYLFKVKSNEIFKAKNNNQIDQKYGVVENNDRTATLPLLMTGTVDNPKFSYDVKTKKLIVKENVKQEKKDIQNAFKQEIREILGKKDSTQIKKEPVKKASIKVEWEEE